MFSLIIAIVSIALVVALVAISAFYGGGSISDAAARAEAARIQNEEQQLLAAVDMFQAQHGRWPLNIAELVSSGQLRSELRGPVALGNSRGLELLSAAYADALTGWDTPLSGQPVFTTSAVRLEVCRQYNLLSRGDDGILRQPFSGLRGQCWGEDGNYRVVVAKAGAAFAAAMEPADVVEGAVPDKNAAGVWDVAPSGAEPGTGTGGSNGGTPGGGTGGGTGGDTGGGTGGDTGGGTGSGPGSEPEPPVEEPKVPQLSMLSSAAEAFGVVKVGQVSVGGQRFISNGGTGVLNGLSVTAPQGFSVVQSTCGATLAAGQSCSFALQFSPGQAVAYSGQVLVASADGGSASFAVSGQGGAAQLAISSTAMLDMGVVQVGTRKTSASRTLTNSGNADLTGLAVQPPAGFTVVSGDCSSSLAAGASCSFALEFAPTTANYYGGTLPVTSTDGGTVSFIVSGEGAEPKATIESLAFADQDAGVPLARAVTLRNTGLIPLTLTPPTAASVTGKGFAFESTTCQNTLAPSATCQTTVVFNPTGAELAQGALVIDTSAGRKTASLSGQSLGPVVAFDVPTLNFAANYKTENSGTQVTVRNTGNKVALLGYAVERFGNTISSTYSVSTTAACVIEPRPDNSYPIIVRLEPGANCAFNVNYRGYTSVADTSQPLMARLSMTGDPNVTASVNLEGRVSVLQSSVASLSWGGTAVQGVPNVKTFQLTNTGTSATTQPVQVSATGTGAGFAVDAADCAKTLVPGQSCTVQVTYTRPPAGTTYTSRIFSFSWYNKLSAAQVSVNMLP